MAQELFTLTLCDSIDDKYRFGFNGKEKDNEIKGIGNHNTALFWEYDTRLGRRWNVDPVDQISVSNYATFKNNPISKVDIAGNLPAIAIAPEVVAGMIATSAGFAYLYGQYQQVGVIDWTGAWKEMKKSFSALTKVNVPIVDYTFRPLIASDATYMAPYITRNIDYESVANTSVRTISDKDVKQETQKAFYHVTYQMQNDKTGQVYVGRTSGYGTPASLVKKRVANHHMTKKGFNIKTAIPTFAAESVVGNYIQRDIDPSYYVIRAAEQDQIDEWDNQNKKGNAISGISKNNKKGDYYYQAYEINKDTYQASDGTQRDNDNCADCGIMQTKPTFPNLTTQ